MVVMPMSEQNEFQIFTALDVSGNIGAIISRVDYSFETGSFVSYEICVLLKRSHRKAFYCQTHVVTSA